MKILIFIFLIIFFKPDIKAEFLDSTQKNGNEHMTFNYMIHFDTNWKPLQISSMDKNHKILSTIAPDIKVYNLPDGKELVRLGEGEKKGSISCDIKFYRIVALTDNEVSNYLKYKFTSISTIYSIKDYYYTSTQKPGSTECESTITDVLYHKVFNPDIKTNFPLQMYMEKGISMGITPDGRDTITSEGYHAILEIDGKPNIDYYTRYYNDYKLISTCIANKAGKQDDVYQIDFYRKDKLYFRCISGNLYKACFIIDPSNPDNCLVAYVNNDGSVDYIVGKFNSLYDNYLNNRIPRIETNTTLFFESYIKKFPQLVLWNIKKVSQYLPNDLGKIGDTKDPVTFALLIQQAYLTNQGIWGSLIDKGETWVDRFSDKIGANNIFNSFFIK